jgi:hypothetical protein
MKKGRICKKQRQAEQLRKKRAGPASVLAQGAKKPVAAVPIASRPQRLSVGRTTGVSEPLPPMSYPIKKAALGKPQTAGDR